MIIRDRDIHADGWIVSHPDAEIVFSAELSQIFVEFLAFKTLEKQKKEEEGDAHGKVSFTGTQSYH